MLTGLEVCSRHVLWYRAKTHVLEQQDADGEQTATLRVELAHAIRQLEQRWRVGCILAAVLPVRTARRQCW